MKLWESADEHHGTRAVLTGQTLPGAPTVARISLNDDRTGDAVTICLRVEDVRLLWSVLGMLLGVVDRGE